MKPIYKFGQLNQNGDDVPYEYADIWAREKTSGPDRIAIAPRSHQTDLLYKLAECLEEPFLLLYVLVVPRSADEPGRYQSNYSFTLPQLRQFLTTYADFLEKDARHNLWIRPELGDGLLVYDRHNVIYAYDPLDKLVSKLISSGLTEADEVRYPSPHVHHYNSEFDSDQARILKEEQWTISPLRPGDENPE
jgi:hypothetical protein